MNAFEFLVNPNQIESDSVDARMQIDLKLNQSFSRCLASYFKNKYSGLDANSVVYDSGQITTLGLCVQRQEEIVSFNPEPKYYLRLQVKNDLQELFDMSSVNNPYTVKEKAQTIANLFHTPSLSLKVISKVISDHVIKHPKPLNTVQMLRAASTQMNLGPHQAMKVAEALYQKGVITYPKTDTQVYPQKFNFLELVQQFQYDEFFAQYAQLIMQKGVTPPRQGIDARDHPPIIPIKYATQQEILNQQEWIFYQYIVAHFLATISPNCTYQKVQIKAQLQNLIFEIEGLRIIDPGFTLLLAQSAPQEKFIPSLQKEDQVLVQKYRIDTDYTKPPGHFTEAELLKTMQKKGIGTDQCMSLHIDNICQKFYVQVQNPGRYLVPTKLGIALVHGIQKIDPELTSSKIRADIERQIGLVAKGSIKANLVLHNTLTLFKKKYQYFEGNLHLIEHLFFAAFSGEQAGRVLTKCGRCSQYMKFISQKPTRLYCEKCYNTFFLPQTHLDRGMDNVIKNDGVSIREFKAQRCPQDNFELILAGTDSCSIPLCPNCFSLNKVTCLNCPNTSCKQHENNLKLGTCECSGTIFLDQGDTRKIFCNKCWKYSALNFKGMSFKIQAQKCTSCSSFQLMKLVSSNTDKTVCIACDLNIQYNKISLSYSTQKLKQELLRTFSQQTPRAKHTSSKTSKKHFY